MTKPANLNALKVGAVVFPTDQGGEKRRGSAEIPRFLNVVGSAPGGPCTSCHPRELIPRQTTRR